MTIQTQPVPTAPHTPAYQDTPRQFTDNDTEHEWTDQSELKAAWQEIHERHGVTGPPAKPFNPRKLSAGTDALNYTLAAFNVPAEFRAYIDALVGLSAGSLDWFDASDFQVGQRARDGESRITRGALTKWTQRQRNEFADWQESQGVTLIEVMPGGQDRHGERHKSRYRLPVLELALQVHRDAQASREWTRSRDKAMRRAAGVTVRNVISSLTAPPVRERFNRPRRTAETYKRLVETYLDKMAGAALLEHGHLREYLADVRDIIDHKLELIDQLNLPVEMSENARTQNSQVTEIKDLPDTPYGHICPRSDGETAAEKQARWPAYIDTVLAGDEAEVVHTLKNTPMDKLEEEHTPAPAAVCSTTYELDENLTEAQAAVEAFRSVGVKKVGVTLTYQDDYENRYDVYAVEPLSRSIDGIIETAESRGATKVIGRPLRIDAVAHIQVDDPTKNIDELRQLSFLLEETSPSNCQGWVAVQLDNLSYDDARRAVIQYFGGDVGASGATRWPGSHNRKYDPAPLVRVRAVQAGLVLTESDIAHMIPLPVEKPERPRQVAGHDRKRRDPIDWHLMAAARPAASPSHTDWYCSLAHAQDGQPESYAAQWLLDNSPDIEKRKRNPRAYAQETVRKAYRYLGAV